MPDQLADALSNVYHWGKERWNLNPETHTPILITMAEDGATVITELEKFGLRPTAKRGSQTFADVKSFCAYIKEHYQAGTILVGSYGSTDTKATFDWHSSEHPGFGDHTSILKLVKSPEWTEWIGSNGKPFSQTDFADFIEDQAHIVDESEGVDPARLIEVALNLRANVDCRYESKINMANGAYQLAYTESVTDQTKGSFKVPASFTITLRPFRGAKPVQMLVRLRYRVKDGAAMFHYKLDRPDRVLETALEEIWKGVEEGSGLPVLRAP